MSIPLPWAGDFSTGNLKQWSSYNGAVGSLVVQDATQFPPPPGCTHSLLHHVSDSDVTAATLPGAQGVNRSHPAAAVIKGVGGVQGTDFYCGRSFLIEREQPGAPGGVFPLIDPTNRAKPHPEGMWFQLGEFFGPPFAESPPLDIDLQDYQGANHLVVRGNGAAGWPIYWRSPQPVEYDAWQRYVIHVHVDRDPAIGFIEMWFNGKQAPGVKGQNRMHMAPIDAGSTVANLYVDQYRCLGLGTIDTHSGDVRVGKTLAQVA